MKTTDKILVTGASGFIGSRLVKSLYENGFTDIRATSWSRDLRNDFEGVTCEPGALDPNSCTVEEPASLVDEPWRAGSPLEVRVNCLGLRCHVLKYILEVLKVLWRISVDFVWKHFRSNLLVFWDQRHA